MTLEHKALRTLRNLVQVEATAGAGIALRFWFEPFPGSSARDAQNGFMSPIGLAYACVDTEIPLVMRLLRDRGLIFPGDSVEEGTTIYILPEGYAAVDRYKSGQSTGNRSAFLVCRFTEPLDSIFDAAYKPLGDDPMLGCPIRRVKDVHHVERIDDKILQMIMEASVVLVDLTDHNFNVAFEAGFALAKDKPIVWTIESSGEGLGLPFDIQSHNVLLYDRNKLKEFQESLRYRMLAALQRAASPSRVR